MTIFSRQALAGAVLAGAIGSGGCKTLGDCVDPCWPERYNYKARNEVIAAFAPQVQNGHILDQTLYNTAFVAGTDELTNIGRDQLDTLVRRRPYPDPRIFLATARDIPYEAANPGTFVETRRNLDNARAASIQKYVGAQTAGRPMQFEVVVHDPMPVGEHADPANKSIRLNQQAFTGSLYGGQSATTASSTGASGGTGSGGGGGGGTTK
ncbi:MAG TPA: hypothetical protein VL371_03005 [Gemmataceae bacterium]|jgi:hypothetical protein|nr:hypothetical protein [Gemmataceae bacterium]